MCRDLGGNRLRSIDQAALSSLVTLTELSVYMTITQNNIVPSFDICRLLRGLGGNMFSTIPSNTFAHLTILEHL